jgi:hypothetical protein
MIVGLLVKSTEVAVEVAAFEEVGVLEVPHPAIKATGSNAITVKQPISFFIFNSPKKIVFKKISVQAKLAFSLPK